MCATAKKAATTKFYKGNIVKDAAGITVMVSANNYTKNKFQGVVLENNGFPIDKGTLSYFLKDTFTETAESVNVTAVKY